MINQSSSTTPTQPQSTMQSQRHHHHRSHHHRHHPEVTIVCADNSEYMRNEDYCITRWAAQRQALSLLVAGGRNISTNSSSSTNANAIQDIPPSSFALILMAGRHPSLASAPGSDPLAFLTSLDSAELNGSCKLIDSLKLALMASRSATRSKSKAHARVVIFIGSPPFESFADPNLRLLSQSFKNFTIPVDIFCFGEPSTAIEWQKTLEEFVRFSSVSPSFAMPFSRNRGVVTTLDSSDSHFVRVPPYGASGGVDSLAFHILRTLVRDRDTAKQMWKNAFGESDTETTSSSNTNKSNTEITTSANQTQKSSSSSLPPRLEDPLTVDRFGVPVLRMSPPSDSCRQAVLISDAIQQSIGPTILKEELFKQQQKQLQQQQSSISFTLAFTPDEIPPSISTTTTTTTTILDSNGKERRGIIMLLPVKQLAKEVLREIPAGRVFVSITGIVASQKRRGSLAFNKLSETLFQFVWRDRLSGNAEYELAVMKGEARTSIKRRPDGRIFALEILRHSRIRMMLFWLQSKDNPEKDNELIQFLNENLDSQSMSNKINSALSSHQYSSSSSSSSSPSNSASPSSSPSPVVPTRPISPSLTIHSKHNSPTRPPSSKTTTTKAAAAATTTTSSSNNNNHNSNKNIEETLFGPRPHPSQVKRPPAKREEFESMLNNLTQTTKHKEETEPEPEEETNTNTNTNTNANTNNNTLPIKLMSPPPSPRLAPLPSPIDSPPITSPRSSPVKKSAIELHYDSPFKIRSSLSYSNSSHFSLPKFPSSPPPPPPPSPISHGIGPSPLSKEQSTTSPLQQSDESDMTIPNTPIINHQNVSQDASQQNSQEKEQQQQEMSDNDIISGFD